MSTFASPRQPELPSMRRAWWLPISALHAAALWALAHTAVVGREPTVPAALAVHVVATPTVPPAEPLPLRTPAAVAPHAAWVPVPEVLVLPVVEAVPTAAVAAITPQIAAPTKTEALSAPTAASAVASVPRPERQVAISQVEYLSPPVLAYPLASRRAREQGRVDVRVRVDEQGRPERFAVARSSGADRLDEAALAAVRATRFKPYAEDGVARPFWVVMPLIFELDH